MQRSTEVESVPDASRPIKLANGITFTGEERQRNEWYDDDVAVYALVPPRGTKKNCTGNVDCHGCLHVC